MADNNANGQDTGNIPQNKQDTITIDNNPATFIAAYQGTTAGKLVLQQLLLHFNNVLSHGATISNQKGQLQLQVTELTQDNTGLEQTYLNLLEQNQNLQWEVTASQLCELHLHRWITHPTPLQTPLQDTLAASTLAMTLLPSLLVNQT
jgi:hypothetical protein